MSLSQNVYASPIVNDDKTMRKKITFSHNEDPKDRQTRTVYFDTLGDFYKNMEARKEELVSAPVRRTCRRGRY